MKPQFDQIDINLPMQAGGEFEATVMQITSRNPDGTPATWLPVSHHRARNLILPAGKASNPFAIHTTAANTGQNQYCHAGTGTTPNKVTLDGTFSQTGTTITRASGTGVFVSGNVNDFVKFATGETAKITAFTNSVTVEVDRGQTVAAAALTVYDTSRVALETWVKATLTKDTASGANGYTNDTDTGIHTVWNTWNFAVETGAQTYTEVGIGTAAGSTAQLFSRVVFETPVPVAIDQFLQVKYTLRLVLGAFRTSSPYTLAITGWPYPYAIQSITSNGTYWDVVVSPDCNAHYATGRQITIANALPATTAITGITSTASDFTVTANSHGKTTGQSIVIAGATPAGYNGTWTVASTTTNTITVTSAANLGAGSGGTVRLATPATWYNGTHTIASFPAANTIRITNANSIVAAGAAGTVTNAMTANAIISGKAFNTDQFFGSATINNRGACDVSGSGSGATATLHVIAEAAVATGMQYGVTKSIPTTLKSQSFGTWTVDTANRKATLTFVIASGDANSTTIKQLALAFNYGTLWITFDERQRKDNGYQLTLTFTETWQPDLA